MCTKLRYSVHQNMVAVTRFIIKMMKTTTSENRTTWYFGDL